MSNEERLSYPGITNNNTPKENEAVVTQLSHACIRTSPRQLEEEEGRCQRIQFLSHTSQCSQID